MYRLSHKSRKGMALIIVLVFAVLLLVFFASMAFQHRSVAGRNKINLRDQQAFFAARAAMQHFLLKARLFPTELYDAVEFKQGKNPYFDFSEFPFRADDGKPAFQELPSYSGIYKRIIPVESDASGRIKFFYIPLRITGGEPEAMLRIASFYNPTIATWLPNLRQIHCQRNIFPLITAATQNTPQANFFCIFSETVATIRSTGRFCSQHCKPRKRQASKPNKAGVSMMKATHIP